jgi:hypothetical protein
LVDSKEIKELIALLKPLISPPTNNGSGNVFTELLNSLQQLQFQLQEWNPPRPFTSDEATMTEGDYNKYQ